MPRVEFIGSALVVDVLANLRDDGVSERLHAGMKLSRQFGVSEFQRQILNDVIRFGFEVIVVKIQRNFNQLRGTRVVFVDPVVRRQRQQDAHVIGCHATLLHYGSKTEVLSP